MQVKVKKLSSNAVIPFKSTDGSSGYDITATSMKVVDEGVFGYIEYGTGLSMVVPKGYAGLIFPRSSISNKGLILSNSVGVIDPDYRGEVRARFKHITGTTKYEVGDKIAQFILVKNPIVTFKEVDDLDATERGEGGFGSTDDIIY